MFYKFIGADKIQNFELAKVLFLENRSLEQDFQKYFTELTHKTMTHQVAQLSTKIETSSNDVAKTEWKEWILRYFNDYVARISGNEDINLITGRE
jgi:hypothetical protein